MKVDKDKDSNIDLETKKKGSNPYLTRILINLSLVAYIKPGRDAPRGTSNNLQLRSHISSHSIQDRLDRD
jgi:hypothetical protein